VSAGGPRYHPPAEVGGTSTPIHSKVRVLCEKIDTHTEAY